MTSLAHGRPMLSPSFSGSARRVRSALAESGVVVCLTAVGRGGRATAADSVVCTKVCATSDPTENGVLMQKNYGQVRRQRELAKKARQEEKMQRRVARVSTAAPTADIATPEAEAAPLGKPTVRDAS